MNIATENCPYGGGEMEQGCVLGDMGNNWRTFQWFVGEPTVLKNMWPFGEEVGTLELFKGPTC